MYGSASLVNSPFLFAPISAANTNRRQISITMSLQQQNPPNPNLITTITRLLWGQSLPPHLLISTARSVWSTVWHLMMSQLAPSSSSGSYSRPLSQFQFRPNSPHFPPKSLHLYVSLPCPWAHRTLIVRALKGLEETVPISIASPSLDGSFEFGLPAGDGLVPGFDNANGCRNLREVYKLRSGGYDGRCTVPMLWDSIKNNVVCNESYDIIEFFNSGLNEFALNPGLDLSPQSLKSKIEEWNGVIYPNVNNGVYRCGFAQSQEAYDVAVNQLFSTLDILDTHLHSSRYLCGDFLTLADICLFTTLFRFDLVYNVLFKCAKKKILEYPNLYGYMKDIYQIPKVAETCNFQAIMDGYYKTLFPLNPGSICPISPSGSQHEELSMSHGREFLSVANTSTPQSFIF